MTKQQFAEFHKYLAMLIYEYNKIFSNYDVSEKTREEVGRILEHLNEVMKICIIDGRG